MVAASLTNIFLMFLLLQVGNSCAQPHQGEPAVKEILIQLTGSSLMKLKEVIHDISATSELKDTRPGGRKMMLKTVFNNEQQVKMDTLNVEGSDISGAVQFVGICDNKEKGTSKEKCKLSHRSSHPVKSKYVGFATFSADYHVPKSHPPKNN